jgi:hypothetical protein
VQTGKRWIMRRTHAHGLLKGFGMTLDETDGSVKAGVGLARYESQGKDSGESHSTAVSTENTGVI